MSMANYLHSDVESALDAAGLTDRIINITSADIDTRARALIADIDAALIVFGEEGRTDLPEPGVTLSTGGAGSLLQLVSGTPTEWAKEEPWIRSAETLIAQVLATVPEVSAGSVAPVDPSAPTTPDTAAMATLIMDRSNEITVAAISVLRSSVRLAIETHFPEAVPVMDSDGVTFNATAMAIITAIGSATPLVDWPVEVFDTKGNALSADASSLIQPDGFVTGPDTYVP